MKFEIPLQDQVNKYFTAHKSEIDRFVGHAESLTTEFSNVERFADLTTLPRMILSATDVYGNQGTLSMRVLAWNRQESRFEFTSSRWSGFSATRSGEILAPQYV